MLRTVKIVLEPDREEKCHYNMASLFHGILMEKIDRNYAGHLHHSGLKPFSQYLGSEKGDNLWIWTISTLTEQAWQEIGKPLLNDDLTEFILKDKDLRLAVREKREEHPYTYRELTGKYYLNENPKRNIKINFLTPCSFKSANQYAIFPELSLIYKSLMNKYDAFSDQFSLKNDEALQHLCQYTRIRSYYLRSTYYYLEGVKIPSFIGKLDLIISGPETMVSLANLLFSFGEWSGIGIKTALGMGAIKIE
ncbi:CRISPR system precrRNA processing endoribonuclease RAMP protein Cas6 [Desulfotruncus alcoholivorax]|uniref:CRISPR system precrRNA processing endoribonuclease RAMP protein Cas6 n=1 Tax=Desulfotruncus alcoholivorax TaxID=265477 RepID=UPI00041877D1|nr:CRISPR system precrRNA processing endoribonuclease RAMP protein Cas6 [Desulfotruncus alcoholivorax]